MIVGPVAHIPIAGGWQAPLYLLRFDGDGTLLSPRTAERLMISVSKATDVYWFSHGWNNTYRQALERYRHFAHGFVTQRATLGLPTPPGYRPVLIGVIWPSTSFVLPWEEGPNIAASNDEDAGGELEELLRFVTEGMDADAASALAESVDGRSGLTREEALEAAGVVLAAVAGSYDPDMALVLPAAGNLLESWRAVQEADQPFLADDPDDHGEPADFAAPMSPIDGGPRAAGVEVLDPRNLLRVGTMWKMKARAGVVGARGVGPLLRDVLHLSDARVHLIGHSFGARVLLSALASEPPSRQVRSILLLQAAVNRWCFAPHVDLTDAPGGYHVVLERVQQPILTTFSSHDLPLHGIFHLALRGRHLGEPMIAARSDIDLYGALGGYGPNGLDDLLTTQDALPPGEDYTLAGAQRVVAIDGAARIAGVVAIGGHGKISNPATWWALHNLAAPDA